jgi:hypothetical protein
MKKFKLAVLSILALAFGRPGGYCTANAQSDDIAALQAQVARQEEELKRLREAQPIPPAPPEELNSTLAMLCRGAGVELEDVRWRMASGLDQETAVQAAVAQLAEDERAAATKKGGKK